MIRLLVEIVGLLALWLAIIFAALMVAAYFAKAPPPPLLIKADYQTCTPISPGPVVKHKGIILRGVASTSEIS